MAGTSAETARGRGRAGRSAETARGRGRGRTLGPAKSTRNVGKKRAANATTGGTAGQNDDAATGNIQRRGYRTGLEVHTICYLEMTDNPVQYQI
jgi:hypothetical protein